ncbi:hypothetical protein C8R45DRAFT_934582 [Mycena sanguinolenta]|nr:hypothetical protein C8R45DRAFT_934582 [Mycena sanguinolenta]
MTKSGKQYLARHSHRQNPRQDPGGVTLLSQEDLAHPRSCQRVNYAQTQQNVRGNGPAGRRPKLTCRYSLWVGLGPVGSDPTRLPHGIYFLEDLPYQISTQNDLSAETRIEELSRWINGHGMYLCRFFGNGQITTQISNEMVFILGLLRRIAFSTNSISATVARD